LLVLDRIQVNLGGILVVEIAPLRVYDIGSIRLLHLEGVLLSLQLLELFEVVLLLQIWILLQGRQVQLLKFPGFEGQRRLLLGRWLLARESLSPEVVIVLQFGQTDLVLSLRDWLVCSLVQVQLYRALAEVVVGVGYRYLTSQGVFLR